MTDEILHYFIKPSCTLCKECVGRCPTQSIHLGLKQYVIDSDTCMACGECFVVCKDFAIEILRERVVLSKSS